MKITLILFIREIFTILKVRTPVYFEIRVTAAIKRISFHYLLSACKPYGLCDR
jgi:hypothetical protein